MKIKIGVSGLVLKKKSFIIRFSYTRFMNVRKSSVRDNENKCCEKIKLTLHITEYKNRGTYCSSAKFNR